MHLDGSWGFPPFSNSTRSCTPGECNQPDWSLPLPEAIARVRVCVLAVVRLFSFQLEPVHVVCHHQLAQELGTEVWHTHPSASAMTLLQIMSQLKPHTIVLNHGLWHLIFGAPAWSPELHDAVMRAANEAVLPQGGQAIWKTTSYVHRGWVSRDFDNVSVEQALAHGWLVMDEWALTFPLTHFSEPHPAYLDNTHFAG